MAFFVQYRNLCKRVQQQLQDFDDQEKGQKLTSPRLSGETAPGDTQKQNGNAEKDVSSDDDLPNRSAPSKSSDEAFPYAKLDGISLETTEKGERYYLVDWESESDPQNPRNWTLFARVKTVFLLIAIVFGPTVSSSIDSGVAQQAAKAFGVSEVVESLGGTAMFLIGFGLGALLASPASEMVGRYPVYVVSNVIFACWVVGAALSPNIGAQIVFRFLSGLFSSAPLTVGGGSISDLFNAKEKTWAFPLFAGIGFGGPVLGPVISSYIGVTGVLSWRWADWIVLITIGLILALVLSFKQETLAPQLLLYKARHFRKLTGDQRFKTAAEASGKTIGAIIKTNFTRPFILALEPIVFFFTLYLTIIYIVLFTFLDGYTYIFQETYGINQGLSNLCFLGLMVGIFASNVTVPLVYHITMKQLARDGDDGTGAALNQETRLIFSMIGAPLLPIGLFWMAWTDYASISIWSPLVASGVIGFGIICIFMSAYMYVIDSYETYAASALTFVALVRYLAAGGMTVVGVPFYKNLETHWTLTVLACISILVMPIPYVLYIWGSKVRARSKYAIGE